MNRLRTFGVVLSLTCAWWLSGSVVQAEELDAHVLALVDETSGFRVKRHRAIRILDSGTVESLEKEKWVEIAKLSEAAVARFKRTTEVMSPKIKMHTKESGYADGPISKYLVKNKEGEVVLIRRKGPEDGILMQGGRVVDCRGPGRVQNVVGDFVLNRTSSPNAAVFTQSTGRMTDAFFDCRNRLCDHVDVGSGRISR